MSLFIEGLIAGYGIAIPVGAVAVLIINMGMLFESNCAHI